MQSSSRQSGEQLSCRIYCRLEAGTPIANPERRHPGGTERRLKAGAPSLEMPDESGHSKIGEYISLPEVLKVKQRAGDFFATQCD
jgi:hypothetical protein